MFFDRKEREVEKQFLQQFGEVGKALGHLKALLGDYLRGDKEFKADSMQVHESEHAADLVKESIERMLYQGAFMPINRGDYIILAEFIDRMANQAESTANLIVLTRPQIPDFLKADLPVLLAASIDAFNALREALVMLHTDIKKVKEAVDRVLVFEKTADEIEWEAVKKVFKSPLELAHKLQLRELINDLAAISDQAKDTAERFGIMLVKQAI